MHDPLTSAILQECKRLATIRCHWFRDDKLATLADIVSRNAATLEQVDDIDALGATEALLAALAQAPKLKSLVLGELSMELEQRGGLGAVVNGQMLATTIATNCRKLQELKLQWEPVTDRFACPPSLSTLLNSGERLLRIIVM